MSSSAEVSSSALSGTTTELFRLWCRACWQKKESDLHAEAAGFFHSLLETTQVQIDDGTVLHTKGSHEQALAVLIQTMGPIIWNQTGTDEETDDGSIKRQVNGLVARRRALSCLAGALQGCRKASLSTGIVQSLGDFLTTLAGPVQLDDEEEEDPDSDLDEQLRDAALTVLQKLLASPLPSNKQALTQRLTLAQVAVQQRCAVAELADNEVRMGRVRSGLATLPRSRRSLCFSTLEAPLGVLNSTPAPASMETVDHFVKFCASCLHGESDPRCLLQILKLLHRVQQKLGPLFSDLPFPASEVFDAVAPYYPIQFTPPPNDVHGITREGLSTALWNVLSYTDNDKVLLQKGHDSMVSLSLGIFLDTLNPPPEDGPPTLKDQEDALECICGLLLGLKPTLTKESSQVGKTDRILLLDPLTLRQVVDIVWATHGQASNKMASSDAYRTLTYQCRAFVSILALTVEQAANTKAKGAAALFRTVVMERLGKLSSTNPNDLAYLACVASSGGVRCLHICMQVGLKPRVQSLRKIADQPMGDVCDGIAAAVAACKAGCDRIQKRGVTLSPHPLEPYAAECFTALHRIFVQTLSPSSARALESLLSAAPSSVWNVDELLSPVEEMFDRLLKPIIEDESSMDTEPVDKKWADCCVQIVARFCSLAGSGAESDSVLAQEPFLGAVGKIVYRLVHSCATVSTKSERLDRWCLGEACKSSLSQAQIVTTRLLGQLVESTAKECSNTAALVEALSSLIALGGANVSLELQRVAEGPNLLCVISALSQSSDENGSSGVPGTFGVSTLELPPTDEEKRGLKNRITALYRLILPVVPDYSHAVLSAHRREILSALEKVLPPLREEDVIRLSSLLPFAAKMLQHSFEFSPEEEASWVALTGYLADYSLGHEPLQSRKLAAETLHGVLTNVQQDEPQCPILSLMNDVVLYEAVSLTKRIEQREKSKKDSKLERQKLVEIIAFVGLLGSAATLRGYSSAETSAFISDFLIDLSTKFASMFRCGTAVSFAFPSTGDPGFLSLVAADAFGSMIVSATDRSLSGQRLRYFATKRFRDTVNSIRSLTPGMVVVAAHLCCSVNLNSQELEATKLFLEVILGGLKRLGSGGFEMPATARKIALAALIKIQTIRSDVIEPFIYPLVTSVLRAYATADGSDSQRDIIAGKILALQVLEEAAMMPVSKDAFFQLKQAVITILRAALNEKTDALCHASVDVLNAWYAL